MRTSFLFLPPPSNMSYAIRSPLEATCFPSEDYGWSRLCSDRKLKVSKIADS